MAMDAVAGLVMRYKTGAFGIVDVPQTNQRDFITGVSWKQCHWLHGNGYLGFEKLNSFNNGFCLRSSLS